MEYFSCPTEIAAGPGSVSRLRALKPRRLFLVTDPYFEKNGTAREIAAAAGAEEAEIYSAVRPAPTVELAAAGTAALRSFRPDVVAALGGGSALDLARTMVYFSGQKVLPAAIPTTSGSEVTDFAILTHQGTQRPPVNSRLRPRLAILDSDLLGQPPPALIADTGFDVLTHAAEAGLAFSQSGLCHALSHSLGGGFRVPHGRRNAILLPAVIGVNAHAAQKAYAALASAAGISGSTPAVRNLRGGLLRLRSRLPSTLAQGKPVYRYPPGLPEPGPGLRLCGSQAGA